MANKLILVVDDDESMLQMMRLMLIRSGYEVKLAATPTEALKILDEVTPDLIIIDAVLPDMLGPELCMNIRARNDATFVPILGWVGGGSKDDGISAQEFIQMFLGARADEARHKGTRDDLIPIVQELLENRRQGLARQSSGDSSQSFYQHSKIGELSNLAPEQVLTSLAKIDKNRWENTINSLLRSNATEIASRALIALALWHRKDYIDAPYNLTPGHRLFWANIRHSLGSYSAEEALERWKSIVPIARALTAHKKQNESLDWCLEDRNWECRQWVLRILLENRSPQVIMAAQLLVRDDKNGNVRAMAAQVIAEMGSAKDIPLLIQAINDNEPGVREHAAEALVSIGGEHGKKALLITLEKGTADAAEAAAGSLSKIFDSEVLRALIQAATVRTEARVLQQIAHALGEIGNIEALEVVHRLSKHPDISVSRIAKLYI